MGEVAGWKSVKEKTKDGSLAHLKEYRIDPKVAMLRYFYHLRWPVAADSGLLLQETGVRSRGGD